MNKQRLEIIICRCEEVTDIEIVKTIRDGAESVNDVKRRTRAGMGLCQGRTCRRLVSQMLAKAQNKPLEQVLPPTFRPPVRPVKLSLLAFENIVKGDEGTAKAENYPNKFNDPQISEPVI